MHESANAKANCSFDARCEVSYFEVEVVIIDANR